ncbi:putative flavin-dependent thymidylate synthase [Frankliniella fusca]|uniref:Flavin-dependent thymidylate synthase n=1 Tax=Frankliniella fusca TaxID=407009 RepID=A0AAE1LGR9_9NEOP|nr:putative flavin-dependent thymidylate synthase [Frankliniella fusca]
MQCPLCTSITSRSEFHQHLYIFHRKRKGCQIICPYGDRDACVPPIPSVSAYLKHYYKYHAEQTTSSKIPSVSRTVSESHVQPQPLHVPASSPSGLCSTSSAGTCALEVEPESFTEQRHPASDLSQANNEAECGTDFENEHQPTISFESSSAQCSTLKSSENIVVGVERACVSENDSNIFSENDCGSDILTENISGCVSEIITESACESVNENICESATERKSDQVQLEKCVSSLHQDEARTNQRKRPVTVHENDDELQWEDISDHDCFDEVGVAFQKQTSRRTSEKLENVLPEAADLVLYLRDMASVPQNAVDATVQHCETIIKTQLSSFSALVDSALASKNIKLRDVIDVDATINSASAFKGIKTKAQQDTYFSKKYNVTKPMTVFVGRQLKRKRRRVTGIRETILAENSVVYNPILSFIKKILKHPDWKKVTSPSNFSPDKEILDSFLKSERYLNSDFFKDHPNALRIYLYFDEFDSCDSLASKAGKHKQGAFYLTFDNVHPKYRSNLDFISLVALVSSNTIKDVGMDMVLQPILTDLKKLEKGVKVPDGEIIYGSVIAIIGDNLGVHATCGFKEGFTANRTCHHCMVTLHQLRTMTSEKEELLRNIDDYKEQVKKISSATTKKRKEELKTEYGLNRESCLNELETFHVLSSIVADEMHDLWEGCFPTQIKKLLHHLISGEKPIITLDWLNAVLRDFDYEYSEVLNKPSLIRRSHVEEADGRLHQSSAQMWQMAAYLPVMLGPHIDDDDKHWMNFLELLEIARIVSSHEIPKYELDYLADLIESYLTDYQELYGHLIPKQHFLVHYPRLIRLNGPLSLYSCMRMEAFHRRFKREAYSIGNYTALSASLASRHALHQAVVLSKPLIPEIEYGPKKKLKLSETSYNRLLVGSEEVVESLWVKRLGVTYISNRCFIAVNVSDFLEGFAKVIHIVVWPEPLFICEEATTASFSPHMSAFELKRENVQALKVFKPDQLLGHSVFHSHVIEEKEWIVTKYCINGSF